MSDAAAPGAVTPVPGDDPGPVPVLIDRAGTILQAPAALPHLLGSATASATGPGRSLYDLVTNADRATLHQLLVQSTPAGAGAHAAVLTGRRDDGLPLVVTATVPVGGTRDDGTTVVLTRWGGPVAWAGGPALDPPERTGPDHVLSHDARATVRNARNFVNLFARKLAAADPPAPDLPASHLETALRALATGDETLDRIVWFMRLEHDPLSMQAIPLATLVELARRQAAADLADRATVAGQEDLATPLAVDLAPLASSPLDVVGHLDLLTWAFAEAMVNARKFGGPDAAVSIDARADGGVVSVRITNTGRPIAAELAEDAFRLGRMLQARGERPGVGLGLPLARRILLRHGGRAAFEAGDATCLTLTLLGGAASPPTPADDLFGGA